MPWKRRTRLFATGGSGRLQGSTRRPTTAVLLSELRRTVRWRRCLCRGRALWPSPSGLLRFYRVLLTLSCTSSKVRANLSNASENGVLPSLWHRAIRSMCANAAGPVRGGACYNPNLLQVTGDGLERPTYCEVDPKGPLGQLVSITNPF